MNHPPRLLVALTASDRSELALWRGLQAGGMELFATCDPETQNYGELCESGFPVEPLAVRNRIDLNAAAALRKHLRHFKPDAIYAPANRTLAASLFATRGTRTKVIGYRGTIGHLSRWDPAAWITYLHRRLSHIVCVSNAVERYLRDDMHMRAAKVSTIYKGHDPDWYSNPAPVALGEFGIPDGAFTVAFAGNMRPVKGVDVLLKALRLLPADSRIRLLLIGEIRDNAVHQLASDPEIAARAHFVGYRTDAPSLIAACDAFVMPSVEREGLPRAVFEAMAQSKPVVVSDVGGMPEQVQDGHTGLVVPPRDPAALASALLRLEGDRALSARLGEAGSQRLSSKFHISRTIAAFQTLIGEIIS